MHKTHGPTDLNDALEHIMYEVWKYRQSVAHYGRIQEAGSDAALEFRVLHHRVLLEFFYGYPKHEDNIVAGEYIVDWGRTHDRATIPWFAEYMRRCHTMLAHISTTRSEMARQGLKCWSNEWRTVEPHLDQTITDFLGGLSVSHKDTCLYWFNQWLKGCPMSDVLSDLVQIVRASR